LADTFAYEMSSTCSENYISTRTAAEIICGERCWLQH